LACRAAPPFGSGDSRAPLVALAADHDRSFAKHRTITALGHARALKTLRVERAGPEIEVQQRSLDVYDALIA
jgi:hypothetical protein